MGFASDKWGMCADRIVTSNYKLGTGTSYAPDSPVQDVEGTVQFEPFGLQWRTLSPKDKFKKVIFLFSLLAAGGYYLFLGILAII